MAKHVNKDTAFMTYADLDKMTHPFNFRNLGIEGWIADSVKIEYQIGVKPEDDPIFNTVFKANESALLSTTFVDYSNNELLFRIYVLDKHRMADAVPEIKSGLMGISDIATDYLAAYEEAMTALYTGNLGKIYDYIDDSPEINGGLDVSIINVTQGQIDDFDMTQVWHNLSGNMAELEFNASFIMSHSAAYKSCMTKYEQDAINLMLYMMMPGNAQ